MALILGTASLLNHALIISVIALLMQAESILNCFGVLKTGFRLKKHCIHRFLRGIMFPLAAGMRPAKALIYKCVGFGPKASWIKT
jgi:hypothetical protein